MSNTILLIGCGNMGFAMLKGWRKQDPSLKIHVVESFQANCDRAKAEGAFAVSAISDLPEGLSPELIFIAVKPQMVTEALQQTRQYARMGACYVSVAAGITIQMMEKALPTGAGIIRCMPNTSTAIGEGMMALAMGKHASKTAQQLTKSLLSSSGAVAVVENEAQMDAVTAISGSGPAYFFLFIEALIEAGRGLGLPEDVATLLAKQTALGAGKMVFASEESPSQLRENVTSPNGTTAAALDIFMKDDQLKRMVKRATLAAAKRSEELGKS